MRVLVSGSRGFIGTALLSLLSSEKIEAGGLVRSSFSKEMDRDVVWDPAKGKIDLKALEGWDAVVHLAGESIAEGRWTSAKKERILKSRVQGTRFLTESLAKLSNPPKIFICASAIGFYGDRGDEILTESSAAGSLFLSKVCKEWEEACQPAAAKGLRVVNLRFGVILGKGGGALPKMLLPFKLGVGGVIGSGKQWMSWISIEDAAGVILHAIKNQNLSGPVNVVAPNPVTNSDFTKILGKVLQRPTFFPLPAFAARLVMGQMADELLLASARVQPDKLLQTGYSFKHPQLEATLSELI